MSFRFLSFCQNKGDLTRVCPHLLTFFASRHINPLDTTVGGQNNASIDYENHLIFPCFRLFPWQRGSSGCEKRSRFVVSRRYGTFVFRDCSDHLDLSIHPKENAVLAWRTGRRLSELRITKLRRNRLRVSHRKSTSRNIVSGKYRDAQRISTGQETSFGVSELRTSLDIESFSLRLNGFGEQLSYETWYSFP